MNNGDMDTANQYHVEHIDVALITPDPDQPRKDFNQEALADLAASIQKEGLQQPIGVRPAPADFAGEKRYIIIFGERRWRAHCLLGKGTIRAQVSRGLTEKQVSAIQMIENVQREDLNPVERAEFLKRRLDALADEDSPLDALAEEVGKSKSWVSKSLQILKYDEPIRAVAREGLVRDYAILRRVQNLKPAKKAEALEMIQAGTFEAKSFFARKRYDKKPATAEERSGGTVSQAKSKRAPSPSFDEWKSLIKVTDYQARLAKDYTRWEQEWDNNPQEAEKMVEGFRSWVAAVANEEAAA